MSWVRNNDSMPTWIIPKSILEKGINIIELLWGTDKFKSKSEIRRLIKDGAVKIHH